MSKSTVIVVAAILLGLFGAAVYYGVTHARGIPSGAEPVKRQLLEAPFSDREIDLDSGIGAEVWSSLAGREIEMNYQVMVLPWGKSPLKPVTVKAFHNKKDIYFYVSWQDDTQDLEATVDKFTDACAIMFPLGDNAKASTIMMGFMGEANVWHWKASQDRQYWLKDEPGINPYTDLYYSFEEDEMFVVSKTVVKSAVNDLLAIRVGTVTPKQTQSVSGRGIYENGVWQVVFKRAMASGDNESAKMSPGKKHLCAFGVWNGSNGDRGGRKSISDWVELEVK